MRRHPLGGRMDPGPHGAALHGAALHGATPHDGAPNPRAMAGSRWKALPVRHGYTNSTERVAAGVRKSYAGPDTLTRADAEWRALARLADLVPVPAVVDRQVDGSIVTESRPGEHGQDLIEEGHADEVLASCGALLRRLHALDPGRLVPGPHPSTHVVLHSDFGPNNILLDSGDYTITALLDWSSGRWPGHRRHRLVRMDRADAPPHCQTVADAVLRRVREASVMGRTTACHGGPLSLAGSVRAPVGCAW
jgi:aminoglycoside phosphotransferase (APT) family kinase protein